MFYRARPIDGKILAYIGQTVRSLRQRVWELRVSHVLCPDMTEHYQRLEWENDYIGAWVERTGGPPKRQF